MRIKLHQTLLRLVKLTEECGRDSTNRELARRIQEAIDGDLSRPVTTLDTTELGKWFDEFIPLEMGIETDITSLELIVRADIPRYAQFMTS